MLPKAFAFLALFALPAAAGAQMADGPPPFPGERPEACAYSDQAFARVAEALIAQGINAERARYAPDAPRLKSDPELARIARVRSCDMAHGDDFSHTDTQGNFIAGNMVEARFGPYGAIGENIMKMGASLAPIATRPFGPEEFARVAVDGWMKSPGHRENILNPRYDLSGIGVAMVDGQAFATQVFHGQAATAKRTKRSSGPF